MAPVRYTWRDVAGMSIENIKPLVNAVNRKWQSGEPIFKEMASIRTFVAAELYGKRVATDVPWFVDFLNRDSELFPVFARITEHAILTVNFCSPLLDAALHFIAMRVLQISDRPCWYSLSEGLIYNLLGTQLKGVYPDDIRLPFPGFFIEIPPGILTLKNDLTGTHEVRAMSLCEGVVFPDNPARKESGRRLLICVYCEPNDRSVSPSDDHIYYMTVPLGDPAVSIEDLIARDSEVLGDIEKEMEAVDGGEIVGQQRTIGDIRQLLRNFAINFLLYLRSPEADIQHTSARRVSQLRKEKKGSKKHKAQIERLLSEPSWVVGSKIVLKPQLREAVRESLAIRKGKPLTFKVLVSGFWRKQWYGKKTPESPKGQEQRPKWIEPHVRGGDLPGAVLGHEYVVEGEGS